MLIRLLAGQLLLSLLAAGAWAALGSPREALAALSGGAIGVFSTGFFAARVFLRQRGSDAGNMLRNFVAAELMKLGLLVALFVVAIKLFADVFLPLIATYALTSLVYLWALRWTASEGGSKQGTE